MHHRHPLHERPPPLHTHPLEWRSSKTAHLRRWRDDGRCGHSEICSVRRFDGSATASGGLTLIASAAAAEGARSPRSSGPRGLVSTIHPACSIGRPPQRRAGCRDITPHQAQRDLFGPQHHRKARAVGRLPPDICETPRTRKREGRRALTRQAADQRSDDPVVDAKPTRVSLLVDVPPPVQQADVDRHAPSGRR